MNETLEKVTELINRASQLTGHDMAGSFYAVTGETDLDFEDSDPMTDIFEFRKTIKKLDEIKLKHIKNIIHCLKEVMKERDIDKLGEHGLKTIAEGLYDGDYFLAKDQIYGEYYIVKEFMTPKFVYDYNPITE